MQPSNKYKLSKSQEQVLRDKLSKSLMTMVAIVGGLVITLVFFAPKLGVFFGFFSAHKNDKDEFAAIKPNPPLLVNVPHAAKDYTISINGFAAAGLTIDLFVNGPKADTTTVGADGQFTFNNVTLIDGNNTIFARAIDKDNNQSDPSSQYTLIVDKEKPKIEISYPKDGDTIRNLDKRVTIRGKVNKKATLMINDKVAVIRPDLSFEFLMGLIEGNNEIKIKVTDEAGNEQEEKLVVKYVKGS